VLVRGAHREVDRAYLKSPRLFEKGHARSHVRIVDVSERVRLARQRQRAREILERHVPLRRADGRNQQEPRRAARVPFLLELGV
jgi:hypothetical protein